MSWVFRITASSLTAAGNQSKQILIRSTKLLIVELLDVPGQKKCCWRLTKTASTYVRKLGTVGRKQKEPKRHDEGLHQGGYRAADYKTTFVATSPPKLRCQAKNHELVDVAMRLQSLS